MGIPETKEISFNPDIMRRHELSIQNVRRQNNSVEKAIAIASRDDVDLSFMISHKLPLEDVQHGFNLLANYQDNAVKVMIHP